MDMIQRADRILKLGVGYRRHFGSDERELAELECLVEIRRCLQAMVLSDKKLVEQYDKLLKTDPGTDPAVAEALKAEAEQKRLLVQLQQKEKEEYDRQFQQGSRAPEGLGVQAPRATSSDIMNAPMPEIDYSGKLDD